MGRKLDGDEPTLAEAWTMLGNQLGLSVRPDGENAVRADGIVRGRTVSVSIERERARSEGWRFLFGLNTISSRNRREKWHTTLSVSCANPSGATGAVTSAVDVNDPAWNPREYDPRNGRSVRCDPPALVDKAVTPDIHERLMSVMDDVTIHVGTQAILIDDHSTALPGSGANYVAGSLIHHFLGSPPPWPERALVGPPWWIDLLCDMADALDR